MDYLNWYTLQLPLVTAFVTLAIGSHILPAPRVLFDLLKQEWFKWFVMFVAIYQCGGMQNTQLAAMTTIIVYVFVRVLDMVYEKY